MYNRRGGGGLPSQSFQKVFSCLVPHTPADRRPPSMARPLSGIIGIAFSRIDSGMTAVEIVYIHTREVDMYRR